MSTETKNTAVPRKRVTVAAALTADEFAVMEDLCIDLRIRRNSDFVREAIREKLERHGKVVAAEGADGK